MIGIPLICAVVGERNNSGLILFSVQRGSSVINFI